MSANQPQRPERPVCDVRRKNKSIRFNDDEWREVHGAAERTPEGALFERSWWKNGGSQPATFTQAVALDWARYVNALPATQQGQKPTAVLKVLQERNAQLEALLRAHGVDPNAAPPVEEHKGTATTLRQRRAAGGRR